MSGPLVGVEAMESAGQGPAPFAGMMLTDLGAALIRVERPGGPPQMEGLPEWMTAAARRSR